MINALKKRKQGRWKEKKHTWETVDHTVGAAFLQAGPSPEGREGGMLMAEVFSERAKCVQRSWARNATSARDAVCRYNIRDFRKTWIHKEEILKCLSAPHPDRLCQAFNEKEE